MEVETFEQETALETHPEVNEEALLIIEELGLEGQKPNDEGKRPLYPVMTKDEIFIYKTLCPCKYEIKEYQRTAIPLRVLQALAYCKENKLFEHFSIWDVEDTTIKDPVLVGWNGYKWSPDALCLIARWGEVLDSLNVLKEQALVVANTRYKDALSIIKRKCELMDDLTINELRDGEGYPIIPNLGFEKVSEE